ncbi:MAG: hypothetical protein PVF07_08805 [Thiogranum sp.]
MNRTVQQLRSGRAPATEGEHTLSLQVIDAGELASPPADGPGAAGQPHCLLCLVALERPRIRSTTQRRWRLRDRLNGGDASRNAGILARDPHFWDYLQQINLMAYEDEIDTDRARQFINRACRVSGRHEFERSSDAALRFFSLIEEPFLAWLLATDHD